MSYNSIIVVTLISNIISSPHGGIICPLELSMLLEIVDFNYHPVNKIIFSILSEKSVTKLNLKIIDQNWDSNNFDQII